MRERVQSDAVTRRGFMTLAGAGVATGMLAWPAEPALAASGRRWRSITARAQQRQSLSKKRPAVAYCPVDPTDGRDTAAELSAWLQSLPSGTIADLRGRTYRAETAVKVTDKAGLTIRNGGLRRTVVGALEWPTPNPHLWLLRPVDCRVENLTVRGTNTVADQRAGFGAYRVAYEFEAAVRLERFSNCRVTGLDADGVWGDGVQWQVGSGAYMADCRIDRVGRQGVTTIGSNILIERVRVEHGRRSGFDLEPDTAVQGVHDIEIRSSFTNTIGLAYASAGRGPVNNVFIHHNTSAGPSVPVLYVRASDGSRRANWRFEDHVALNGLGSPAEAIRLVNVDNFSIARNVLPVASTQSRLAFGAQGCGGVCNVTGNNFGDAAYYFNRNNVPGQALNVADTLTAIA